VVRRRSRTRRRVEQAATLIRGYLPFSKLIGFQQQQDRMEVPHKLQRLDRYRASAVPSGGSAASAAGHHEDVGHPDGRTRIANFAPSPRNSSRNWTGVSPQVPVNDLAHDWRRRRNDRPHRRKSPGFPLPRRGHHHAGIDREWPTHYDLAINTDLWTADEAADFIVAAARRRA
jgi:hypothetical protein